MKKTLIIHPEECTKKWVNRAKAAGCTTLALHPVGGKKAYESLKVLLDLCNEKSFKDLVDYAKSAGLEIEYQMHAARYLLPEALFSKHPEWFRMNENGERTPDLNFCVSNSDALDFVAENAVTLAKSLYGSTHKFYFWMDDAKSGRCLCEQCRNRSTSDQQMIVVNAMIKRLQREIPDAQLSYLAYFDAMPLPQQERPVDGIFLEYAPFERDFTKGAVCMAEDEQRQIKKLLHYFGTTHSVVLEYWYDNSMYSTWKKPPKKFSPDNQMIQQDLLFYQQFGFDTIASFACYLGEDYEKLYGEPDVSAFNNDKI